MAGLGGAMMIVNLSKYSQVTAVSHSYGGMAPPSTYTKKHSQTSGLVRIGKSLKWCKSDFNRDPSPLRFAVKTALLHFHW